MHVILRVQLIQYNMLEQSILTMSIITWQTTQLKKTGKKREITPTSSTLRFTFARTRCTIKQAKEMMFPTQLTAIFTTTDASCVLGYMIVV